MVLRDFFIFDESFSTSDSDKKEGSFDSKINLSKLSDGIKLHPGDIIMDKGNIVGVQSIRKSIMGGETLDLVNKDGSNKVTPKSELKSIIIIKSGNKLNEDAFDKIPMDSCKDCEDCTEDEKESSAKRISVDYKKIKDILKDDEDNKSDDSDNSNDSNDSNDSDNSKDNDKLLASKLQSLSVTISDILDHMKKNSLNRTGMSSYRVNTV